MSDSEPIIPPQEASSQAVQQASTTTTKPAGAGGDSGYTADTTVSSMSELREKAPKVFEAMLEGIAMQITSQMKRRSDRLRELMRKGRENG